MYLYDTVSGMVDDPLEHRDLTAEINKRSRYFLVNPAKATESHRIGGQEEVGLRFWEGAGAGAVLLGQAPKSDVFTEHFDWPDAVVEMPFGSTEAGEIIAEMDRQPERLARIRRDNVVHCLERHDWTHRWVHALEAMKITPLPAAEARLGELAALANSIPEYGLTEDAVEREAQPERFGGSAPPGSDRPPGDR
jgi:hypothetical protein